MRSILAVLRQAFFFEVDEGEFRPRWRLISLVGVAVALAMLSAYLWIDAIQPPAGGADLGTVLHLKCTNPDCGHVAHLTVREIQQMVKGPVSWSALVITCPQCGQKSLTHANECSNCGEVFIVIPGRPETNLCPKCRTNYLETSGQNVHYNR